MDQCYNALMNQLDWTDPEGDRCPYDLSKPLPLQGSPGHLTIPVDFFFNNNLEYLKTGNAKRKYTISITKTKATRSQINRFSQHNVYSKMTILSVVSVKNKLFNLDCDDIVDLAVPLRMFTRQIIIQKMVEDVQLGVESYQKKLNITKPQKEFPRISYKEPYTTSYDPKGFVYLNEKKRLRLMRADELYKFSDRMLKYVREILRYRLLNFKLGYNKDMPKIKWTENDQNQTDIMVNLIDKQLLERRIMWSL
ncbi:hypothetical protein Tco_0066431 [Tanacetum coccineum]